MGEIVCNKKDDNVGPLGSNANYGATSDRMRGRGDYKETKY